MLTHPKSLFRNYQAGPAGMHWKLPSKARLKITLRQWAAMDLRWSYYAIAALVVGGILINALLPNGWTVWPLVLAAGILLMIHEAADRNGTGIPPLHVYALAAGGLALWIFTVSILSVFNPVILLIAIMGMGYYCTKKYLEVRQHQKILAGRRELGLCLHCAHPINPRMRYCESCGREPNPDQAILERISNVPRTAGEKARARAALKPDSRAASASKKEQVLLARKRTGKLPAKRR